MQELLIREQQDKSTWQFKKNMNYGLVENADRRNRSIKQMLTVVVIGFFIFQTNLYFIIFQIKVHRGMAGQKICS